MLAVYAGLLILIAVATGVVTFKWLSSPSQDHLVVIGNFLMLGTLLLALVAGIVALAAYSAATGLPNLKLQFKLSPAQFNEVIFSYPLVEGLPPVTSDNGTLSLVVKNTSSYAARTPVVSVEFRGAGIPSDKYAPSEGWMPTARDLGGYIIALQWDGGPNSIHGISSRSLPELNLEGRQGPPGPAQGPLAGSPGRGRQWPANGPWRSTERERDGQPCTASALTWASVVERVTRIELALSAWEADVLPLNYTRGHLAGLLGPPRRRHDIVPESRTHHETHSA
jgi:hypothetical protein